MLIILRIWGSDFKKPLDLYIVLAFTDSGIALSYMLPWQCRGFINCIIIIIIIIITFIHIMILVF